MIATWALIGIASGFASALTGGGGAMIAVPMFLHLTDAGVKDSTALSLVVVLASSSINGLLLARMTQYRLILPLFVFAAVGSAWSKPLKVASPEGGVALLFALVALTSLALLWRQKLRGGGTSHPVITHAWIKLPIGGVLTGVLVTMTGLGGGVLLVPLISGVLGFKLEQAIATSLPIIFLSALFSLWLQWESLTTPIDPFAVAALVLGCLSAGLLTRAIAKRSDPKRMDTFRYTVITLIMLSATLSVLARGL